MSRSVSPIYNDCQHGAKLIAQRAFARGEVVLQVSPTLRKSTPCYQSVQIAEHEHIIHPTLNYINHSCDPSIHFDAEALECRAIRDLSKGDEITFFYPTTEWVMNQPFDCNCGSDKCCGRMSGARDMSLELLRNYEVNPHIQRLLQSK